MSIPYPTLLRNLICQAQHVNTSSLGGEFMAVLWQAKQARVVHVCLFLFSLGLLKTKQNTIPVHF